MKNWNLTSSNHQTETWLYWLWLKMVPIEPSNFGVLKHQTSEIPNGATIFNPVSVDDETGTWLQSTKGKGTSDPGRAERIC